MDELSLGEIQKASLNILLDPSLEVEHKNN